MNVCQSLETSNIDTRQVMQHFRTGRVHILLAVVTLFVVGCGTESDKFDYEIRILGLSDPAVPQTFEDQNIDHYVYYNMEVRTGYVDYTPPPRPAVLYEFDRITREPAENNPFDLIIDSSASHYASFHQLEPGKYTADIYAVFEEQEIVESPVRVPVHLKQVRFEIDGTGQMFDPDGNAVEHVTVDLTEASEEEEEMETPPLTP